MSGLRLDVCDLACCRGGKTIFSGLSFSLLPGECMGLLGASGCGKSTLLRALVGELPLSQGLVRYNGGCLGDLAPGTIGYVPQDDIVHMALKVRTALTYAAQLRAGTAERAAACDFTALVNEVIELVELTEQADLRIQTLSGGQRKRVSIALELLGNPGLLLLDEPTSGLDPALESRFMQLFSTLTGRGCTVVLTTHVLQSLQALDVVAIMAAGRLVWFGPPDQAPLWFGVGDLPNIYAMLADPEVASAWAEKFFHSAHYLHYVVKRLNTAP